METGIRLRGLLDGLLNNSKIDYTDYRIRNQVIDRIEESLNSADWIELSDGTTYKKVFTPTYFKEQEKKLEELRKQPLFRELNSEEELQFRAWARKPESFKIPVKHGLRNFGYINNKTCEMWEGEE